MRDHQGVCPTAEVNRKLGPELNRASNTIVDNVQAKAIYERTIRPSGDCIRVEAML